jgi:hypothetical protein
LEITDDYMRQMIAKTKHYRVVILRHGPNEGKQGAERINWAHGRRNFELRRNGLLPIVCPVVDGSDISGIGIFTVSVDEVKKIMDADQGVMDCVFVYEVHYCRSFLGACLA